MCVHMTRQHLPPGATDLAPDMRGIPAPLPLPRRLSRHFCASRAAGQQQTHSSSA